jgi:serine/threonine protein kinase
MPDAKSSESFVDLNGDSFDPNAPSAPGFSMLDVPVPPSFAIPGFEMFEEIGQGGMGKVYRARQMSLDRIVAIKVIGEQFLTNRLAVRRFQREAQIAARLAHPNIVSIYQAGEIQGRQYLVLEYVDGRNLHDMVSHQGPLPVETACRYLRQAALGLQHAHERGLVHRDIKPANLIVNPTTGILKILDMGLARLSDPSFGGVASMMTRIGTFMGTPDFVAPEQAMDARAADIRSDLYSLGCTFYFVLVGSVPFPVEHVLEKMDKHRWEMPTPVESLRPEIPAGVGDICRKLMAKRPADRFQEPKALAAALQPFAGETGLSVLLPTPSAFDLSSMSSLPELSASNSTNNEAQVFATNPASISMPSSAGDGQDTLPEALMKASTGECLCWEGHRGPVQAIAFLRGGLRIASASKDGTLRIWSLVTGQQHRRWPVSGSGLSLLVPSPDGRRLLVGDEHHLVRIWDMREGRELMIFPQLTNPVACGVFSPDATRLLTGSTDGVIRLWDVKTGSRIRRFEGHGGQVWCLLFENEGREFISAAADGTIRRWDTETGRQIISLDLPLQLDRKHSVTCAAFSGNGRFLVSGGSDHLVSLWDALTGKRLSRFQGHRGWVYSVAFSPTGRHVLSGGGDKTLRYWHIGQNREIACFMGHTNRIATVAFAPEGRFAASAGFDRTIRIWRLPQ